MSGFLFNVSTPTSGVRRAVVDSMDKIEEYYAGMEFMLTPDIQEAIDKKYGKLEARRIKQLAIDASKVSLRSINFASLISSSASAGASTPADAVPVLASLVAQLAQITLDLSNIILQDAPNQES